MLNIKTIIIACAIAFSVGAGTAGIAAWKYQSNKYEKEIKNAEVQQYKQSLADAGEALRKDRWNANTTQALERKWLEASEKLASVQAGFARYRDERGGLRIQSDSCTKQAGTPDTASSSVADGSAIPGASCNLSRATSEALISTAADADTMRERLSVCKAYAEEIEAQRKRMMEEDNGRKQ